MIGNDFLCERLHGLACGDQLIEDLGAIVVAFNHCLDALELPRDLAEADLQDAAVGIGVGWAV